MAKRFNEARFPARAVSADTGREERTESLRLLRQPEIVASSPGPRIKVRRSTCSSGEGAA
jgi:hypothetical protein